jgi:hypothetical protein
MEQATIHLYILIGAMMVAIRGGIGGKVKKYKN